jgi:hypothetical protein
LSWPIRRETSFASCRISATLTPRLSHRCRRALARSARDSNRFSRVVWSGRPGPRNLTVCARQSAP